MKITYREAKKRSLKKREIWSRRLLCDPIATPIAYLLVRYTRVAPIQLTIGTFLLGLGAGILFGFGNLLLGATLCLLWFFSDSMDGKLNRVLGKDDTYRGMVDYIFDGVSCLAIVIGLGMNGDKSLLLLLLSWMAIHYLVMKLTSAAYRLKVQFGDRDVWLINRQSKGWLLKTYRKFIDRTGVYPHPTIGESVILTFVVGPILWQLIGIEWMYIMVGIGVLCIIPETIGAGLVTYSLASKEKEVK